MPLIRSLIKGIVDGIAGENQDQMKGPKDAHGEAPVDSETPDMDDYDQRKSRRERKKKDRTTVKDAALSLSIFHRIIMVFTMIRDREARWKYSLRSVVGWGLLLIIVGIIFLVLAAVGEYPGSVSDMKRIGVFTLSIVKYVLYMVAGAIGMVTVFFARRDVRKNLNTIWYQGLLLLAALISISTIGMTIYSMAEVNDLSSVEWWSWLIMALIITQRIIFAIACFFGIWTLRAAAEDEHIREVIV